MKISDEKLEQMARQYEDDQTDGATFASYADAYKAGFRAAEKMILDGAAEGFEEWFGNNNYLYPNIPRDAWAAAVLSERKKSEARIAKLESAVRDMAGALEDISRTDIARESDMAGAIPQVKWLMNWRHKTKAAACTTLEKHRALIEALKKETK
jgi:hypothetical protein